MNKSLKDSEKMPFYMIEASNGPKGKPTWVSYLVAIVFTVLIAATMK